MISRAEQNWPEDVTITLVEHNNEMKPLGRNLAMRMLLEKHEEPKVPERAPYRHELDPTGTRCSDDCQACEWNRQNSNPVGRNLGEGWHRH